MESRVIIFLVLSLVVIAVYPYFLMKLGISSPESVQTQQDGSINKPIKSETDPSHQATSRPADGLSHAVQDQLAEGAPLAGAGPPAETLKIIEGDLYRVVLSSRGGTIKEWTLTQYKKKDEKGIEQAMELVAPTGKVAPLSITIPGETTPEAYDYSFDGTTLKLSESNPAGRVVMRASLPNGLSITKEFLFHNDQYQADISIRTEGFKNGYQLALGSNFGITDWEKGIGATAGAISMVDGKVLSAPSDETDVTYETGATWFGLHDKYFISALLRPDGGSERTAPDGRGGGDGHSVPGKSTSLSRVSPVAVHRFSEQEVSASIHLPSGTGREDKFILYAGPKEYDRLASYHTFLEESIDFGWFIFGSWLPVRLVAKPLFYVLRFLYKLTENYGFSIIFLTVLVKIIFHPITQKSLTSMKQMATLQPKVNAIREKWANNKEKMNKELMGLYKDSGVNPLGGCMPMLLQMPVFVALFNILYVTIDLKNAPFIFWISDLSSKDPYYVLPVVMGGTMILQQMTQPNTMDPTQAKIMMFMPVVYTFFFLSFPSGLVLYWLVNNTLSIAQQYWINKRHA